MRFLERHVSDLLLKWESIRRGGKTWREDRGGVSRLQSPLLPSPGLEPLYLIHCVFKMFLKMERSMKILPYFLHQFFS